MSTHKRKTQLYVVRTIGGQEENVAKIIAQRIKSKDSNIKAVLAPHTLKGYIILEAMDPVSVDTLLSSLKNVRSRVRSFLRFQDIDKYLEVKPLIEEVASGDLVEITGGPLKGSKAKVVSVDKSKQEITVELLDAAFTFSITLSIDYARILERGAGRK